MTNIVISKSDRKDKKYKAVVNGSKTIHFGAKGYEDYTMHKDNERKQNYINRHKRNEDWNASGVDTAGFYAKHILWNKPTITGSIRDVNKKFKNINVRVAK